MKILSIDHGLKGGYAVSVDSHILVFGRMPTKKILLTIDSKITINIVDVKKLYTIFEKLEPDYTYIEYTNPYGFRVASSSYSQAIIESVLMLLNYNPNRISSIKWKKYFQLPGGQKNKYLSCDLAFKLAPECGKFKLKDNGIAEAVLIGKYAIEKRL